MQSGRQPIIASVSLSSVAGTMLGLFSGISGHALLHPIHLTVMDVPPGYGPPPMSAIYARFFAEMFDPRAGLFETFNSAALQFPSASPPISPDGGLQSPHHQPPQPPLPPGAPPPAAAAASSGSGTACLLPTVAAAAAGRWGRGEGGHIRPFTPPDD